MFIKEKKRGSYTVGAVYSTVFTKKNMLRIIEHT